MGKSLWGNLDELISSVRLPKDILEEQARYLKETFDGLASGRVLSTDLSNNWVRFYKDLGVLCDFTFSFSIFSDYVNRYEYEICKISYGIKIYPVAISIGSGIAEEVKEVFDLNGLDTIIAQDEEALLSVLEKILSSREVHQVLGGLVTIAQRERDSDDAPF